MYFEYLKPGDPYVRLKNVEEIMYKGNPPPLKMLSHYFDRAANIDGIL